MKRYAAIIAILLLVLICGINYAVAADDPPMGGGMMCGKMGGGMMGGGMMNEGMMGGGMHDEMMERAHHIKIMLMNLGLDEKQKAEIDSIMTGHMKDVIKKKADLQIAKIDLKNILSKDPMDMKAAESKLKEIEAIKTAMILAHLNAHQEVKSVLTPEQRKKMKEMMEMHMMGEGMCGCMKDGGMMKEKGYHDHEKMMK